MSVIAASLWCFFLCVCCITNNICFIIVVSPTVAMFPLQGLYIVNIDVQVLFSLVLWWRSIVSFLIDHALSVVLLKRYFLRWTSQFLLVYSLSFILYLTQICRSLFFFAKHLLASIKIGGMRELFLNDHYFRWDRPCQLLFLWMLSIIGEVNVLLYQVPVR